MEPAPMTVNGIGLEGTSSLPSHFRLSVFVYALTTIYCHDHYFYSVPKAVGHGAAESNHAFKRFCATVW